VNLIIDRTFDIFVDVDFVIMFMFIRMVHFEWR
jgi:hypothetical protein